MITPIESSQNPRLKQLRKLHDRKYRDRSGLFAAEGEDMLREAVRFGAHPQAVFYDADAVVPDTPAFDLLADLPDAVERVPVRGRALASASSLGSGSRVIGVWAERWSAPEPDTQGNVALYLHDVADPGNVGAVVRSAFALVPSLIILSAQAADPFGPKAVRASMGAIFGQRIARASFEQARSALGSSYRAIALVLRAGRPLRELDLQGPVLFCLGSERLGLPSSVVAVCDETAQVPLRAPGADSLNVAMAATLCLYESALHRLSEVHG